MDTLSGQRRKDTAFKESDQRVGVSPVSGKKTPLQEVASLVKVSCFIIVLY